MPITSAGQSLAPVLVCGEALVDTFVGEATTTGVALDARLGGSPFNVAVALVRLSQPTAFFGAVSQDAFGKRICEALTAEGVDIRAVARVPQSSTLALVEHDASGQPYYTFHGSKGADRQLPLSALATVRQDLKAIHIGSYATVVAPIADTLRHLIADRRATTLISADPNVRLNVEPDISCWRATWEWILGSAHLVKMSIEDLAALCPGKTPMQAAEVALARGVRLFVVTRGQGGAEAWTPWEHVSVPVAPTHITDTVGAGDTFQAALLDWLITRQATTGTRLAELPRADVEGALRWAARAAAVTCSRRGADPPRRADLT